CTVWTRRTTQTRRPRPGNLSTAVHNRSHRFPQASSALQRLLEHVQRVVQFAVLAAFAADLPHRVQHRRMVATAEQFTDLRHALLCQLLGEVHSDLARHRDRARAPLAVHVGDLDLVVVGDRFLDQLDRDLAGRRRQQVLQRLARDFDRYDPPVEGGEGDHLAESALELADVAAQILRDEKRDVLLHPDAFGFRLLQQDRYPHFELRRLDCDGQPRREAGDQAVLHVLQLFWVGIAGDDDLLATDHQRLEWVEELL